MYVTAYKNTYKNTEMISFILQKWLIDLTSDIWIRKSISSAEPKAECSYLLLFIL